jgi:hypothetical protein
MAYDDLDDRLSAKLREDYERPSKASQHGSSRQMNFWLQLRVNRLSPSLDGTVPTTHLRWHSRAIRPPKRRRPGWPSTRVSSFTTPRRTRAGLIRYRCFFSILTRKLLRRGEFSSREDLVAKMLGFIEHHSETAKPFKWVYDAKVAA